MSSDQEHSETLASSPASAGPNGNSGETSAVVNGELPLVLAREDWPNIDHLVTEDDTPLDSIYTERQQRLLTEPLHSSWAGPGEGRRFVALANVGLFCSVDRPALVPDCLLSLDVELPDDLREKYHRSYFTWMFDKVPDVTLEIVSDRRGGEGGLKMRDYARLRIPYYVVYDPDNLLKGGVLRVFELNRRKYQPLKENWLSDVGLGLVLWSGEYEGARGQWLRWCDEHGQVILTGKEAAEQERQRAEQGAERIKRLEAQLRSLGVDPLA